MKSQELKPGRWFRITLEDSDPLKDSIKDLTEREDIETAWLQVLGELTDGKVASGYDSEVPDDKLMVPLHNSHHVLGGGTVETRNGERDVHLHGPQGREGETATGCWAGEQTVYRGLEVLLVELIED